MVSVISCGGPEDDAAAGPAAWASTWLRLELLMVRVISWGPPAVGTRPCEVITWDRSCVPGHRDKTEQSWA